MNSIDWKRIIVLPLILIFLLSCNGKDPIDGIQSIDKALYTTSYLFNLSDFKIAPFSSSSQGMDIYNNRYLFQAGLIGSDILIIDIETLKLVGIINFDVPFGEPSHMNNINCAVKYHMSDKWPLLYLSQTVGSHSCFVLRLSNDNQSYTLLQTIHYTGNQHYSDSLYDWFVDTKNGFIYAYGYKDGIKEERDIVKFPLPTLDLSIVSFTDDDIIDSFVLKNMSIYQGSKVVNDLLYAPVGYGDSDYPGYVKIIDLKDNSLVTSIPINCGEPESVGQYKDGLIICGGGLSPNYYFFQL